MVGKSVQVEIRAVALAAALEGVAQTEDKGSPEEPGSHVPENGRDHGGVDASVSAEDW